MMIAIASGFLMLYSLLILYYKIMWDLVPEATTDVSVSPKTKISIIVPARDEEKNIGRLLQSILKQNYPAKLFEVIVVDDFSTDNTANIVKQFEQVRYFHLQDWVEESFANSFKKKAIAEAIKRASGTLIVTTDADCEVEENWLRSIEQAYQENDFVAIAAPVIFFSKNSLLNIFQELDFIAMQGITAAVLAAKQGAMCNGANFAYTKQAFEDVNGFENVDHLASGDDMMLMHKFYKNYPERVGYLKNKDAIVQTVAMDTIGSFINQRIRWAGKNKSLADRKVQFVLLFSWVLNASLMIAMFSLISNFDNVLYVLLLLIIKGIAEYFLSADVARFFDRKKRLPFLFILQPLHIFYMTFVGFLGFFNKYTWKKRTVK